MQNPLVTIVIPTYNRLAFVQQAIASVIAQTYTHWELIVVDDGSEDGTSQEIICRPDQRIQFLSLPHTGNIAALRNAGVQAGTGVWLAFLDSDDLWIPEKLDIQIHQLLKEGKRWGYGGFVLMDEEMKSIPNKAGVFRPFSGWIVKELLSTEASVNIGSLLVERLLFEEVGGFNPDPKLLFREDYELVVRLAMQSEALASEELLVRVREHNGRATTVYGSGHDRTAAMYRYFIQSKPEKELVAIARRRLARELAESAASRIQQKKYLQAVERLGRALINGDQVHHVLSVVKRGFNL